MVKRFYSLPPLSSLAAFETAARHGSFKQAASELNVTPGAVSHQIKALEADLQAALFERLHRGVRLTSAGERLFAVLARSFQQTSDTIDQIRTAATDPVITIGASTAVGALWLMPRISAFWREYPSISVNQHISDDAPEVHWSTVDLAVRYGHGNWPMVASELLFSDEIVPVCSPRFADKHRDVSLKTLAQLPLVQMTDVDPAWTNWREWFSAMGQEPQQITGPVLNNYTIALQAAEDGAGVALGWRKLIGPLLASGRLAILTGETLRSPGAFYLTWNRYRQLAEPVSRLRDWLRQMPEP